jgi:hypothetical protein
VTAMTAFPPDDRERRAARPPDDQPGYHKTEPAMATPMRERSRRAGAVSLLVLAVAVLAVVLIVLL